MRPLPQKVQDMGASKEECEAVIAKLGPERLAKCVYHCRMGARSVDFGFLDHKQAASVTGMGLAAATDDLVLSKREVVLVTLLAAELADI